MVEFWFVKIGFKFGYKERASLDQELLFLMVCRISIKKNAVLQTIAERHSYGLIQTFNGF